MEKTFKKSDVKTIGDGRYQVEPNLMLLVRNGGKSRMWVFRYTFANRRRELSLGSALTKTLREARSDVAQCRVLLDRGIDPKAVREQAKGEGKAADTNPLFADYFESHTEEIKQLKNYRREETYKDFIRRIRQHVIPVLGKTQVKGITPVEASELIKDLKGRIPSTAELIRQSMEFIYSLIIRDGLYVGQNPFQWKGVLNTYIGRGFRGSAHRPAPTLETLKADIFTILNRDKRAASGLAIVFGALTATRKQEWLYARWQEIDFDAKVWSIPPDRRKDGQEFPFRVPLSDQAIWLLSTIQRPAYKEAAIFRTRQSGMNPPSEAIPLNFLRTINFGSYCLHGMRSTFRDWAAETGVDFTTAEKCLMHSCTSRTVSAYLRTDLLEQRRVVMQAWADTVLPMEAVQRLEARRAAWMG